MNQTYDAIIIGGGHNGLVTAATLAQAGQNVLVLEQREVLGGAAATEEIFPGFQVNTGAPDAGLFQDEIVRALFLKMYGLEFRQSPVLLFAPQPDGRSLTLWRDEAKSVAEIGRFSRRDAECYPAFVRQVGRMAAILQAMLLLTPPTLSELNINDMMGWGKLGLKVKGLGRQEMMEFLRLLPMPAQDYLDEWFESDALKGALGSSAVIGMMQGPRSAGTTLMFLYQAASGEGCVRAGRFVQGGVGQLSAVLAAVARQHGAEIRTGAAVARVLLADGKATGVALASGETLHARVVISNADPRCTFFELVGPQNLEPRFMRHVRNILYRGSTAKLNLALRDLPWFHGQTTAEQLSGHIVISPSLDYLEKGYDDAKYGRFSAHPHLHITIPTLTDPTLAPTGQHVMCVTMQYAPYHLRDANWNEQREALGNHILHTLSLYAPNLPDLILHRQVLTPLDWEQDYGLTEGSIFHGQMGLDQLLVMRPVPGWGQYRTPIENLYLCGAGTHPGGGVTGAPGYNAAREVLQALRR